MLSCTHQNSGELHEKMDRTVLILFRSNQTLCRLTRSFCFSCNFGNNKSEIVSYCRHCTWMLSWNMDIEWSLKGLLHCATVKPLFCGLLLNVILSVNSGRKIRVPDGSWTTTLRYLGGCSNHWATGDSRVKLWISTGTASSSYIATHWLAHVNSH